MHITTIINKINEVIKVLTTISLIFILPYVIAGLY
ncbi:MAG: hypothetical protein HRU49_13545 [Winogradskyella sp.]|nr:hypothetical protein [Winogradskyella sp.]